MIDEKKIEEAANKYLLNVFNENVIGDADFKEYIRAFKSGINWFKDNLWHDAKEEPKLVKKEGVALLLEHECNGIKTHQVFFYEGDDFFRNYLKKQVIRWLYIEDLMKGGK